MLDVVLPEAWLNAYNGILKKYGPICSWGIACAAVIGPRIAIDAQLRDAAQVGVAGNREKQPERSNVAEPPTNGAANADGFADFTDRPGFSL